MYPPVFTTCTANGSVTALLGSSPCRIYPFGEAPQNVTLPYAVWQLVSGVPENYLSGRPDMDSFTVQIDVYADTASDAREVAEAIRDAIEAACHVVGWYGEGRDRDTDHYRISFGSDWFVEREPTSIT